MNFVKLWRNIYINIQTNEKGNEKRHATETEAAKALGINMYACEMAMHVLGLKKEDFIPEVKDVLGVASFLNLSDGGKTLFI